MVEALKQIMLASEKCKSSNIDLESSDNHQNDSELKPSQLGPWAWKNQIDG